MTDIRPAWSEPFLDGELGTAPHLRLPGRVTRRWAYGDGRGTGVRVAVVDSGIDAEHPAVGEVAASVDVRADADGARRGRAHRGSARRSLRPRHGVRRDHPLARPRCRAGQRQGARHRSPRQRDLLRRGHRLVHPQRRPRREPEPLDEQRELPGDVLGARRPGDVRARGAGVGDEQRTQAVDPERVGRACSPWPAARATTWRRSGATRVGRPSGAPPASTCRLPGVAAAASWPAGTASPRRSSRVTLPASSAPTPGSPRGRRAPCWRRSRGNAPAAPFALTGASLVPPIAERQCRGVRAARLFGPSCGVLRLEVDVPLDGVVDRRRSAALACLRFLLGHVPGSLPLLVTGAIVHDRAARVRTGRHAANVSELTQLM